MITRQQGTRRQGSCLAALVAVSLLCVGDVQAQSDKPTSRDILQPSRRRAATSTAVHEAWLKEVLDLDVRGAAQAYDKIRKTAPRKQPERWLAETRLAELSRLGVASPEPLSIPNRAPAAVRKALQELAEPLPPGHLESLLLDPSAVVKFPKLRPASRMTQTWVRNQVGPTVIERRIRLMNSRNRNSRGGSSSSNNDWRTRWNAIDILRVELEGRRNQAAALRTIYFPSWEPIKVTGAPKENVRKITERLDSWIDEEGLSSQRRAILRDLRKGIETLAVDDPSAAVALVSRIPLYAERLLTTQSDPAKAIPATPAKLQPAKSKPAKKAGGLPSGSAKKANGGDK